MKKEIWKSIKNYPDYQISSFGRVKSFKYHTPRILKQGFNKQNGYLSVALVLYGRESVKRFYTHRLVALHFVKGRTKLRNQVNHKDGNKLNNAEWNVEWSTPKENTNHAYKLGLNIDNGPEGVKNHKSKLTEKEVLRIRNSKRSRKALAKRFGVTVSTIDKVITRQSWQHI